MLIDEILKNPKIFHFGEFLDIPSISKLAGTEHDKAFQTLQLFVSGTFEEYKKNPSKHNVLSAPQLRKLKLLSILSYAAEQKQLSYDFLMQRLEIPNVRDLEDIIIDSMYGGLLEGKLNQKEKMLVVSFAVARDISPSDIPDMLNTLQTLLNACEVRITAPSTLLLYIFSSSLLPRCLCSDLLRVVISLPLFFFLLFFCFCLSSDIHLFLSFCMDAQSIN